MNIKKFWSIWRMRSPQKSKCYNNRPKNNCHYSQLLKDLRDIAVSILDKNKIKLTILLIVEDSHHRAVIGQALIQMIVTDMQPVSIVEDKGFTKFLKVLDPKYTAPSRHTIMRDDLPHLYDSKKINYLKNLPTYRGALSQVTYGHPDVQWHS